MNSDDKQRCDIRLAALGDAERVAALSAQLGYPATAEQVRGRLADLLSDTHHAVFVAVAPDSRVGAWIHVFKRKAIASDGAAEIGGLIVDESCRRGGIGGALVERAAAWARERGCGSLCVQSNVVREDARRFYTGLGFDVIKRQAVFRRTLDALEA